MEEKKRPRNKERTSNKLNPHMAAGWNQTWATLVGGERSHHWGILATQRLHNNLEGA